MEKYIKYIGSACAPKAIASFSKSKSYLNAAETCGAFDIAVLGSAVAAHHSFYLGFRACGYCQNSKHARVFVGSHFWYRGRSAESLPERLSPLAGGRGARVNHEPALVEEFRNWVQVGFDLGIADLPNDNPDLNA